VKPRVSILSPDFKYVPAVATDVARTFARIRREQRQHAEEQCRSETADVVIGVTAKNGASSSLRLCEVPNHASKGGVTGKPGSQTPTVVRTRRMRDQLRLARGGPPSSELESISGLDSVR
jgi:hypothetical protein